MLYQCLILPSSLPASVRIYFCNLLLGASGIVISIYLPKIGSIYYNGRLSPDAQQSLTKNEPPDRNLLCFQVHNNPRLTPCQLLAIWQGLWITLDRSRPFLPPQRHHKVLILPKLRLAQSQLHTPIYHIVGTSPIPEPLVSHLIVAYPIVTASHLILKLWIRHDFLTTTQCPSLRPPSRINTPFSRRRFVW